jgi:predicted NBD/HSP70 family sugar kinase
VDESRGRPLADAVLELIWHHPGGISRAEIARSGGLARSTVSEVVGTLLETGLVFESGDGPSSGGRRPVLLRFNDEARWIVGVDMGSTHVSVALTDLRGHVAAWSECPCDVRDDPDAACTTIEELIGRCIEAKPEVSGKILGLGIAVPAPIDHQRPGVFPSNVLPAWSGHTGLLDMAERLGVPVWFENDANAGVLAEHWWGGLSHLADFTFIKVATGLGAGHLMGGRVYGGAAGMAGEIGHISIDPDGDPCICGNRGCVTTFVGTPALLRRARELAAINTDSRLHRRPVTFDALMGAIEEDDPVGLQVVREAAGYLGTAIAGLLNLLNPGAVVLGGGLMRAGERLLDPLREAIRTRTLVNSVAAVEIRISALGEQNVALGAATVVLSAALTHPSLFTAQART